VIPEPGRTTPTALPRVDLHSVLVPASREAVWTALEEYVAQSLLLPERALLGRALGTRPRAGFEVTGSVPEQRLELAGRHRFARYRLTFELADGPGGTTELRAVTDAAFPGVHGRAYRVLVISSGGHAVVTNRILRLVRRRAVHRVAA